MYYPPPNDAYRGYETGYLPPAQYPIMGASPYPPTITAYPPTTGYTPGPTPYPPSSYPQPTTTYPQMQQPMMQQPAPYPSANTNTYPGTNMYPPPSASFPGPNAANNKRALLIGINYIGNATARLNGCINDATYLKFLLISKFGFMEQNMLILTDDSTDASRRPTKYNILNAINWLTQGVQPGDNLFFSFSGHGGQTRDLDGDEADGYDETILPEDYKTAGTIVDDDLHRVLAARIPYGAKLTCIMDCCHSGTGLDLPFVYSGDRLTTDRSVAYKSTVGDVILFSSCLDHQTAADSKNLSKVAFSGVLTFTFCQSIETHHPYLTHGTLLQTMQRFSAAKGFSQVIQLSSGKQIDLNSAFVL